MRVADPAQYGLIRAILTAPCHVIVCLRAKHTYELAEASGRDGTNRQSVAKFGLGPIQSDDFEYEMYVVATMDMEHRIDVTKSRCPSVEGKTFPPDHQGELAELYAEWLASGEMRAAQSAIDSLVADMESIEDLPQRAQIKQGFVRKFGAPADLVESQIPGAQAWVKDNLQALETSPTVAEAEALLSADQSTPAPLDGAVTS